MLKLKTKFESNYGANRDKSERKIIEKTKGI